MIARVAIAIALLAACGRGRPAPEQPISFDHALHAGAQTIECTECHAGAKTAAHAGLPALGTCLQCHMKPQGEPPTPNERQVRELAAQPGPFRWIQVNRNEGHVYFSHRAHTSIAAMTCEECHGDVKSWTQPPRIPDPSLHDMDACMDCHRARSVTNECSACHR